jgi:hypothetical protein
MRASYSFKGRERRATRQLRIRARSATGRVAEAANYKHELAAQRTRSACPHLRAPGASVPDGHTICRDPENRSQTSAPGTLIPVTNAIEALNAKLRRAVRTRGHFPTDDAATKLLFLVLREAAREWRMPPREWFEAKTQFAIMFDERFVQA